MDSENVITLTGDLDALDIDMQNWEAMTFPFRKRSDDCCIAKYGCTNTELYNKIKQAIQDSQILATEAEGLANTSNMEQLVAKLNKSKETQATTGEVIIDDWVGDTPPSGYGDYLEKQYAKYQALPSSMKIMSDNSSQMIWGYNVINMYTYMKNKWTNYINSTPEDLINKDTLQNYVDSVSESTDPLEMLIRKLDIATYKGSLYESSVLERLSENIDISKTASDGYESDVPYITPWFNPDEMEDLTDTEVDPYDHILGHNTRELHEKIREAMNEGDTDEALRLGWNPSVPYTPEAIKYARERQVRWLKENRPVQIIDLSHFDVVEEASTKKKKTKNPLVKLEPIYITLLSHEGINSKAIRFATRSKYSHAGLAFDEKLDKIYSFNATTPDKTSGLSIENLDFYKRAKDAKLKVMTIFVDSKVKKKMRDYVDAYIKNKDKTHYDWMDLFRIAINKSKDTLYSLNMICSQFTDSILKSCNIDITGKPSNLVLPKDFDLASKINKVFVMFEDKINKYNPIQIAKKVKSLISSSIPDQIITKPIGEALKMIFDDKDMNGFFLETGDIAADEILREIRELLTPTACIVEARKTPVRMTDNGDMMIDLPKSLEDEYQEAHKLLKVYDKSNLEGIKHQLARLYWLSIEIDKSLKKAKKKKDKIYEKDLTDLKARVWNDYTKYMKLVQKVDKTFDFEDYYKHSEYNDKTIVIDRPTMKYTGKVIKAVSKLF